MSSVKNQKLKRWWLELSNYEFTTQNVSGKLNVIPDLLSRLPIDRDLENSRTEYLDEIVLFFPDSVEIFSCL